MKTKAIFFILAIAVIGMLSVAVYGEISGKGNKETEAPESASGYTDKISTAQTGADATGEFTVSAAEQESTRATACAGSTGSTPVTQTTAPAKTSAAVSETDDDDGDYSYAGFNPKPADMECEWNLLLVNRSYILPEDYSAVLAAAAPGYDTKLDERAAPYYTEMFNAAKEDGITLVPLSGNRRISTQKTNFENKIKTYMNQGYDKTAATQKAAKIILPPGCSEHNAGLAMDICSLDTSFENTNEFKWLSKNAADYGFILRYPKNKQSITEITYEPWHWRYVGAAAAKAIKNSGICLEEYLGKA